MFTRLPAILLVLTINVGLTRAEKTKPNATKPLKALLVTGGCCHDYNNQKKILTEGISARANVEWTIVQEGGTSTQHKVSIYSNKDWIKGYDIVVHNECFGQVKDVFVSAVASRIQSGNRGSIGSRAGSDHRLLEAQAHAVDGQRIDSGGRHLHHAVAAAVEVAAAGRHHPRAQHLPDRRQRG